MKNIGLIGNYGKGIAQGFIKDYRKKVDCNVNLVFSQREALCPECLRRFIAEHKLTRLFIDKNVGFCVNTDTGELVYLEGIAEEFDCEIYIVGETA